MENYLTNSRLETIYGLLPENGQFLKELLKKQKVCHTEYVLNQQRLESFEHWPQALHQKPHQMASAGFFYTGCGDRVVCFNCNVGIKEWLKLDEPWEEHAAFSPNCNYLLLKMGADYVKKLRDGVYNDTLTSLNSSSQCPPSPPSTPPPPAATPQPSQEYNENIENINTTCKICFKNDICIVFFPCKHTVTCVDCSITQDNCPICRNIIEASVRIYLS